MSRNGNFICFTLVWLLRVSCTARRSNKSILKEINPEYSLEGLKLKLKFQYFGHLHQYWCKELIHWKRPWYWEGLAEGGEGDNRGWDGWMASLTRWTWHELEWTPGVGDGQEASRAVIHGVTKSRTWLSDWTELMKESLFQTDQWQHLSIFFFVFFTLSGIWLKNYSFPILH